MAKQMASRGDPRGATCEACLKEGTYIKIWRSRAHGKWMTPRCRRPSEARKISIKGARERGNGRVRTTPGEIIMRRKEATVKKKGL
ncbi:hypothetical protein Nepgr_014361 [Nepenthes gracilis]|uniref:Uncharacterized protein n=1 Tax=Nepenthes gracilis TaxID=150966 RepID=A0AAD3SKN3_NEPGR|nr:hypothetical protein Nepgr_014361 [Nepenthes gracilis]